MGVYSEVDLAYPKDCLQFESHSKVLNPQNHEIGNIPNSHYFLYLVVLGLFLPFSDF